jgi:hypothetical protein
MKDREQKLNYNRRYTTTFEHKKPVTPTNKHAHEPKNEPQSIKRAFLDKKAIHEQN